MSRTKEDLRFEFVEMLFALAIGQVAIEFADAIFNNISFTKHPHIYSQLFLGALIISLSWVGWQNSSSTGNTLSIDSIFSIPFIILLVDIFLVSCYFIIVRGAEFTIQNGKATISIDVTTEITWTLVIFITYFLWDILTKLLDISLAHNSQGSFYKVRKYKFKDLCLRTWPTVVCIIASLGFFILRHRPVNNWEAFYLDLALFFIFVLFRGLKPDLKKTQQFQTLNEMPEAFKTLIPAAHVFPVTLIDKAYTTKVVLSIVIPAIGIIASFLYFWLK